MKRVASKGISRQNSMKLNIENDTSINDNSNNENESLDSPIPEIPESQDDKNTETNIEYNQGQWMIQNEPMISDFEEDLPEDFRIPDQPLQPKYKIVKRVKKASSQAQNQSTCRKKVFYGKSLKKGYGKVSSKTAAYFTATFENENSPEKSDDSEYEFFSCSEDEEPPRPQPTVQLPPRKFSIPSKLCILQNLPNQPMAESQPAKRGTRVILFDRDEFALSDDDNSSDSDHDDYITHPKGPGRPRKNKDSYPPPHPTSATGKPKGKPGRKPKEKSTEPKEPKEPKSTKKLGRSEIIVSTEDEELFCLNLTRAQEFMAEKQRIKLAKKMRRILVNQGEEADFSGQEPEINMEIISNHTKYMLIKVLRTVFLDNGQEY
ncbi:hypothetical protein TVAG_160100 [Trichomonas vaginalis G3]|uniref:Uncharacterized protein n=1 Tax=Trichomonas vaginalis (strain ATCC PRA-98 / G3) TaxID=412133 RepID=A2DUV2_TRIV3|nr:hypothetical protein TVAGG3_0259300 [Trichomonas vaginalis G3]EAY15837.1 hypothetical protein TVAG_160100 [Trichomonas vaginalis G3]KAI5524994.1 hypothetical protein TVAGG3_0259300 [Trichomonas vaginalis G3]|eukprot:XP_001328060.1 hypothetical protein [Trichomonas vaginalis G3]